MISPSSFSLVIHGGAGAPPDPKIFRDSLNDILESGKAKLASGASALDTVEYCVTLLEDDPLFNAGKGSVLNSQGGVEMDAALMDGKTLRSGSVAGISKVRNPIRLARLIMENTEHVMLSGDGAEVFATEQGVPREPDDYFVTEHRKKQLEEARRQSKVVLDHSSIEKKFGTVGAVAIDQAGNLAAATSTGGIVNKRYGRVGDTPIPGAGVYAENATCAVSATGYGEQVIRTVLGKHIADDIRWNDISSQEAADRGVRYLVDSVNGLAGVIVIDRFGQIGFAHSTPLLIAAGYRSGDKNFFTF